MASSEGGLGASRNPSFDTAWTDENENFPNLAVEVALKNEKAPWFGEVGAAADSDANI